MRTRISEIIKHTLTRSNVLGTGDLKLNSDIFCISASMSKGDDDKVIFHKVDVDYTWLATKIYVTKQINPEISTIDEFYDEFRSDMSNLDSESSWLHSSIYDRDRSIYSEERELELANLKIETDKIAANLKNETKKQLKNN